MAFNAFDQNLSTHVGLQGGGGSIGLRNSAANILNSSSHNFDVANETGFPITNKHVSNIDYYNSSLFKAKPNQSYDNMLIANRLLNSTVANNKTLDNQFLNDDIGNNMHEKNYIPGNSSILNNKIFPTPLEAQTYKSAIQKAHQIKNDVEFQTAILDPALLQYNQELLHGNLKIDQYELQLQKLAEQEQFLHNQILVAQGVQQQLKIQELNQLQKVKKQVEMRIMEQRYQKLRENYNFHNQGNQKDFQKQQILREKLLKNLEQGLDNNKYEKEKGFKVYVDFVLNLPIGTAQCLIVAKIFKQNDQIKSNFRTRNGMVEKLKYSANKTLLSIIQDKEHYYDIEANSKIVMIFEVNIKKKSTQSNSLIETENLGWTMVELFSQDDDHLIRGKFKLPLYSSSDQMNDTYVYIRVALTSDDELTSEIPLLVEEIEHEYMIPMMHQDTVLQRNRNQNELINLEQEKQLYRIKLKNQQEQENYKNGQLLQPQFNQYNSGHIENNKLLPKASDDRKGIQITVKNLQVIEDNLRAKVRFWILDNKEGIIPDDMNKDCKYETDLYGQINKLESYITKDGFIILDEVQHFFVDIDKYALQHNPGRIFVMFQVYRELDEKFSFPDDNVLLNYKLSKRKFGYEFISEETLPAGKKKMAVKDINYVHLTGYGWYCFPLFRKDQIQTGRFYKNLFELPLRIKPPNDPKSIKRQQTKIDFEISTFSYNKNSMKSQQLHYGQIQEITIRNRRQATHPGINIVKLEDKYDYNNNENQNQSQYQRTQQTAQRSQNYRSNDKNPYNTLNTQYNQNNNNSNQNQNQSQGQRSIQRSGRSNRTRNLNISQNQNSNNSRNRSRTIKIDEDNQGNSRMSVSRRNLQQSYQSKDNLYG